MTHRSRHELLADPHAPAPLVEPVLIEVGVAIDGAVSTIPMDAVELLEPGRASALLGVRRAQQT